MRIGLKNKNLTENNVLYNSQVGALIFMCGIVFKVSSLPGLLSQSLHSSTFWAYLIMSGFDIICLALIYGFMTRDGDSFLVKEKSKSYKIANLLMLFYLMFKGVIYFSYFIIFIVVELFAGIAPTTVIFILLMPMIYLAYKGVTAMARTAELFLLPFLVLIVLNFIMIQSDIDFGRNLPFLTMEPDKFMKTNLSFGLWVGDLLPLVYVKVKQKKFPHVPVSIGFSYAIVNITILVGVALYGAALPYVSNLFIRLSAFNLLALEIGRVEWALLIIVATMAFLESSLIFWGIGEAGKRIFGKRTYTMVAYPIILAISALAVNSSQNFVDLSHGWVGYMMFGISFGIILLYHLLISAQKLKKVFLEAGHMSGEQSSEQPASPSKQQKSRMNEQNEEAQS